MRSLFFIAGFFAWNVAGAQAIAGKLKTAWERFESDSQLRAGIASIYVVDAQTGTVVFERNGGIGLAPASTQKVITAASAYELLGKDFRYSTELRYKGFLQHDTLLGELVIAGSGDPSFGSWRWKQTNADSLLAHFTAAVRAVPIRYYQAWSSDETGWSTESIPDGWIWQDIGQYYGAGSFKLNWHENLFEIHTLPGKEAGEAVAITGSEPDPAQPVVSAARTAAPGTGDNSFVYPSIAGCGAYGGVLTLRGTLPAGKPYSVSGALTDPMHSFWNSFQKQLSAAHISSIPGFVPSGNSTGKVLYAHQSPSLDSLVFWFLRKSINLYGEALLKTMAFRSEGLAETKKGTLLLRSFWKERGIDPIELNIRDGSGLSPENRVTTHAQVQVLQYARKQSWFTGFYLALPEYNGMKLKSGTIGGVKAFCGYHTSKDGVTYTVSFIVNNYNGSERELVQKMFAVLNELK